MKYNRYNMVAMPTNIVLTLDREYKLIVDFQWYGLQEGRFYSYFLASAHEPKADPTPPYFLTKFCMVTGEILPLTVSEGKKAINLLTGILHEYDEVKITGLTTYDLEKLRPNSFKRVKNNHFLIPHPKIRILTDNSFKPTITPTFSVLWG